MQPRALYLADVMDGWFYLNDMSNKVCDEAAAELRRLHAVNAELLEALKMADELAKALEEMKEQIEQSGQTHCLGSCYEAANRLLKTWWKTSGAAIAKAEGK